MYVEGVKLDVEGVNIYVDRMKIGVLEGVR